MLKSLLLTLLGLFFLLNGVGHWVSPRIYEEYAHKRGLISPRLMVRLSGIALILGGLSLITGIGRIYGIVGLAVFLIVASFTIHTFWRESDREMQLLEGTHFAKNMAILIELAYIATS